MSIETIIAAVLVLAVVLLVMKRFGGCCGTKKQNPKDSEDKNCCGHKH